MATRAQQIELLAVGVLYNGAVIATPYAKFLVAGTTTPKTAWDDADKAVAITKKALDAQGRAEVYGDGIYKIQIYSGDPDASGVLLFTVDNYKVTAVAGNTRTITSTTVAGSVDDSLVEADTTSNDITYTLPDAALMAGKIIQIAKSAAANTLTIAAASGQLVNGAASVAYTAQYSTGVFQSNGSNWYVFQTVGDATTLNGLDSTDFQLAASVDGALVHYAASYSLAHNTPTILLMDTEVYDPSNIYAAGTGRFTIPAGWQKVIVSASIAWQQSLPADRTLSAFIQKNDSSSHVGLPFSTLNGSSPVAGFPACSNLRSAVLNVAEGDYFTVKAYQFHASAGAINILGGVGNSWFSIQRIS